MDDVAIDLMRDLGDVPAFVRDRHLTVVASNAPAQAISDAFAPGANLARFAFLDPGPAAGADEGALAIVVGLLRDSIEQHESDDRFRDLVGELAALSAPFTRLWARDTDVPQHGGRVRCDVTGRRFTFREVRAVDDFEHTVVVLAPAG